MKISSHLMIAFYALMAVLLLVIGLGLLIAPQDLLSPLHHSAYLPAPSIWTKQVGISLLLAAALNLYCVFDRTFRPPLHWLLLFFTAGIAATHGKPQGHLWWLWLPVVLYALPLLAKASQRLASLRKSNGGELEGRIKWFNPNKGFGFIVMADEREYFVHFKALKNGNRHSLKNGTRVRFQLRMTERGEQANDVYIQ